MKSFSMSTVPLFVTALLAFALSPVAAVAEGELLVVSYKQDMFSTNPHGKNRPIVNEAAVEAACVAMAIAHNFQMGYAFNLPLPPGVDAWQPVAVFPSLGGVKLANEQLLVDTGLGDEECPYSGSASKTLAQMIRDFLTAGGRMVICPLCWNNRGYEPSDRFAGAELDQAAVPELFLTPGKSVDF